MSLYPERPTFGTVLRSFGSADGLPFAEVLLVNVRAEVMGLTMADTHCTSFAVGRSATADGSVLWGQNLDQDPLNRDLLIILHVEPDQGPAKCLPGLKRVSRHRPAERLILSSITWPNRYGFGSHQTPVAPRLAGYRIASRRATQPESSDRRT